jgi:hypothetical protein
MFRAGGPRFSKLRRSDIIGSNHNNFVNVESESFVEVNAKDCAAKGIPRCARDIRQNKIPGIV